MILSKIYIFQGVIMINFDNCKNCKNVIIFVLLWSSKWPLDQDLKALEWSTLKAGNFKGPEKYTFLIFFMLSILNITVHDEHGLIHCKSLCSGLFCC